MIERMSSSLVDVRMSPQLREVGGPCYWSSRGLCGAILGNGLVVSSLGSDKILDCPLDLLTPALWEAGHLVAVFESGNLGSSLSFAGLGRGRAQCFLWCMAGVGWLLPKTFLSC